MYYCTTSKFIIYNFSFAFFVLEPAGWAHFVSYDHRGLINLKCMSNGIQVIISIVLTIHHILINY